MSKQKVVTQEDLDQNPEWVEQGIKVGDTYPTDEQDEEAASDPASGE